MFNCGKLRAVKDDLRLQIFDKTKWNLIAINHIGHDSNDLSDIMFYILTCI